MRVALDSSALDVNFKAHASRGIGRYVSELTNAIDRFTDPDLEIKTFQYHQLNSKKIADGLINALPCFRQTIKQQFLYPQRLSKLNADLVHFPAHLDAPSRSSIPVAVTVLDLIPLIFKDLYQATKTNFRFKFARWLENRSILNAHLIFAISHNTAKDLNKILGIPLERIIVTHLGVSDQYLALKERKILNTNSDSEKKLLYVGGIDQRKNISTLLKALRLNIDSNPLYRPKLYLAGRINTDDQYPKLQREIESLNLGAHIVETGYLSQLELDNLYLTADLFLFPSFYEGFGFPVLEAMAAGVPVIAANSSSIPEVLGDSGILVEPHDIKGFSEAISGLLDNQDYAQMLSEKAYKRAKLFSWEKTARLTLDGYRTFQKRN